MAKKIDEQKKQVEALKLEIDDLTNKWKRALADYQNLEKQVMAQKQAWIDFATEDLLIKLLPVLQHLENAVLHLKDQGLELTVAQFKKILWQEGLEEINVEPEKTNFDANLMECIDTAQGPENQVLKVLEKGYKLKGRVLKPARVVVGKKTEKN